MTEHWNQQLERYIDGLLSADERAAFERRLADDAPLREAISLQKRIDESVARLHQMPARVATNATGHVNGRATQPVLRLASAGQMMQKSSPQADAARRPWLRRVAIAAVLLLGAWGAWAAVNSIYPMQSGSSPAKSPPVITRTLPLDYYKRTVADGFHPSWVCADDQEFATTIRNAVGQPLQLRPLPEGVRMVGLDYTNVLGPNTLTMLAYADGREVVVIIGREDAPGVPLYMAACDLLMFERKLGHVMLYEITPHAEPRLLDHFFNSDAESK